MSGAAIANTTANPAANANAKGNGNQRVDAERETIYFHKGRDLATLPVPCQVRLSKPGTEEYKYWERQMTHEIFFHLHHYCFGLFEVTKANMGIGVDEAGKKALYRDAITQFDYVLNRWPKQNPLYQEAERMRNEAATKAKAKRIR